MVEGPSVFAREHAPDSRQEVREDLSLLMDALRNVSACENDAALSFAYEYWIRVKDMITKAYKEGGKDYKNGILKGVRDLEMGYRAEQSREAGIHNPSALLWEYLQELRTLDRIRDRK